MVLPTRKAMSDFCVTFRKEGDECIFLTIGRKGLKVLLCWTH